MTGEEKQQRATEFLLSCGSGQVDKVIPWITDNFYFESMKRTNPPGQEDQPIQNIVDRETFLGYAPGVLARTKDGLNLTVDFGMADGDHVALFGNSDATTLKGKTYANTYCWYFRFEGDRIALFREYCDFHLVHTVLRA
jgi:hypothetical protein